ncbi:hypothetical protein A3K34_02960 [candidate division WWE3 bacterium RIFOXYC1_FULL_40_10]|nr:MAG: hypothetical protein A3K58_02960 [candidate division WWE3 bacterium RIFOXYB1_FULL_40_22]OGC61807.1 MAG: hypothetical protein A3K37_02960 [candidate division WWE3 bacterium RIFOXYA1_FULL_40_11]OGC66190.1 MAG: hypothetical protein A3K34_02960 [candidate division WWE3 bacterium RIFOXYC1_FULL_40_10]
MLGRSGLFKAYGGDRLQMESTANELKKLGISVDIKVDTNFDVNDYDLFHIFQLDWVTDHYFYIKKIKPSGKPIILSPIHHNIDEVTKFDDVYAFDFRRISKVLFKNQYNRDVFKNVYRSIGDFNLFRQTVFSIFYGFKRMQEKSLRSVDKVLVQTELEAADLLKGFGVDMDWAKIPNGVSHHFLSIMVPENKLGFSDYIICVGRIEPRKNQLNVIEAVAKLRKELAKDLRLVFVGASNNIKHFEYNAKFSSLVSKFDWIKVIKWIPNSEMPSYFHYAKVAVSASWFETTGLTSLEALFCGTNAVASGERAKEYLGGYASYCDPNDVESIKEAIKKELFAPRPKIDDSVRKEYTWENAAKKTAEEYRKLLK